MNIKATQNIIMLLSILLTSTFMYGQERDLAREKKHADDSILTQKILKAASVSDATQDLRKKIEAQNIKGILEAVKSCDTSFIPLLELYANQKSWYFADVALVRMGKTEYLKQIIDQTLPSEDQSTRYSAIKKLALTESKLAYKRLYELLDDSKVPQSIADDISLSPMSDIVMTELSEIVSNPPNLKGVYDLDKRVLLWKKWFEENKELTEGEEPSKCGVVNTPATKPTIGKIDNSFVNDILFSDYLSLVLLNKLF